MTLELVHHEHGDLEECLREHPQLSWWLKNKYPISSSTDDPGVFFTNSTRELLLLVKAYNLSKVNIADIVLESVNHIFDQSAEIRKLLHQHMVQTIKELLPIR